MKTSTLMMIILSAVLAMSGAPDAVAKGGEDKPVVAILDENGNTVKIDPDNNDVDVASLPAVKIDPSQNGVDANVTNEVEVKNATGSALAVDTGAAVRIPYVVQETVFGGSTNSFIEGFTVPENNIFVVEFVSVRLLCTLGCDGIRSASITFSTGNDSNRQAYFSPRMVTPSASGTDSFIINEMLRIYADPDTEIFFLAFSEPDSSLLGGTVMLSGYLIPADEPSLAP